MFNEPTFSGRADDPYSNDEDRAARPGRWNVWLSRLS
jgi:hypothetical protein